MGRIVQTDIKRSRQKRNLANYKTLITDSSPSSPNFFNLSQIPDEFAWGKNAFLIRGTDSLKSSTEILIEIIDSQGNVVYHETPAYTEDISRAVSIWVYENTVPGLATITILGEAEVDQQGSPVPEKWQGVYNLKWQRKININPNIYNTNNVRFYRPPSIRVDVTKDIETLRPLYRNVNGEVVHPEESFSTTSQNHVGLITITGQNGKINCRLYPTIYGRRYNVLTVNGFNLRRDMVGERIIINREEESLPIKVAPHSSQLTPTPKSLPLQLEIIDVINKYKCYVKVITKEYKNYPSIINLENVQNFLIEYLRDPDYYMPVGDQEKKYSLLKVNVNDIKTISGAVLRGRLYIKNMISDQPYEFIGDYEISPSELLVDLTDPTVPETKRLGVFLDSFDVDSYLSVVDSGDYGISDVLSRNDDKLINSVSVKPPINDNPILFEFNRNKITEPLIAFSDYRLSFKALLSNDTVIRDSKINVYLSIRANNDVDNEGNPLLQNILLAEVVSVGDKFEYKNVNTTFRPLRNSDGSKINVEEVTDSNWNILFEVVKGNWFISDISLIPDQPEGFSPDYSRITFPIDMTEYAEYGDANLRFKLDLFDINNNRVPVNLESRSESVVIGQSQTSFVSERAYYYDNSTYILSYEPILSNEISVYMDSILLSPDEYNIEGNEVTITSPDFEFIYEPPKIIVNYTYYK